MRIEYNLTQSARQAQFVATGNMPPQKQTMQLDVAALTPEDRAAIMPKLIAGNGNMLDVIALVSLAPRENWRFVPALELDSEPTTTFVVNHLRETIAQEAIAAVAEKERQAAVRAAETEQAKLVEKIRLANIEREAQQREKAAAAEEEKRRWADAHGSDHLKRALDRGHNSQRLYVTERAALEAPGFAVDFSDNAKWRSRATPSVAALDAADAADKLDVGAAKIVWLTSPVYEVADDEWVPREAIVIEDYLGKYYLVQEL